MPGRQRLQEIVNDAATELVAEANRLCQAADKPGTVTQEYVAERAQAARAAVDKAEEACRILVKEEGG